MNNSPLGPKVTSKEKLTGLPRFVRSISICGCSLWITGVFFKVKLTQILQVSRAPSDRHSTKIVPVIGLFAFKCDFLNQLWCVIRSHLGTLDNFGIQVDLKIIVQNKIMLEFLRVFIMRATHISILVRERVQLSASGHTDAHHDQSIAVFFRFRFWSIIGTEWNWIDNGQTSSNPVTLLDAWQALLELHQPLSKTNRPKVQFDKTCFTSVFNDSRESNGKKTWGFELERTKYYHQMNLFTLPAPLTSTLDGTVSCRGLCLHISVVCGILAGRRLTGGWGFL